MNKILYCPWCDRYAREPWYHCPFCHSQTIYIKAWDKKSDEEKKEWLKKFPKVDPPRPIKDKSLLREAENSTNKPVLNLKKKLALLNTNQLAQYATVLIWRKSPALTRLWI